MHERTRNRDLHARAGYGGGDTGMGASHTDKSSELDSVLDRCSSAHKRAKQTVVRNGMSLTLLAAITTLSACSAPDIGTKDRHTIIQKCPAIAPDIQCPKWAEGTPQTAVELQEAWLRGREAHSECEAVAKIWIESWEACGMRVR